MNLLKHQKDNVQTFCLLILINLAKNLEQVDLEYVYPCLLETFINHSSPNCRKAFYTFVSESSKLSALKNSVYLDKMNRIAMTSALSDPDLEISNAMSSFLNTEALPRNLLDRIYDIFRLFPYFNTIDCII